jgi:hypothetical protein
LVLEIMVVLLNLEGKELFMAFWSREKYSQPFSSWNVNIQKKQWFCAMGIYSRGWLKWPLQAFVEPTSMETSLETTFHNVIHLWILIRESINILKTSKTKLQLRFHE